VVPISEVEGMHLDGCFIGACTTAEEDLILAGMILDLGLKRGLRPVKAGKRKVVPGSLPILHKLKGLGFVEIYEQAGFEVGIPGCSYCVGMGADKADKGEVWLSSQNRNFENRMGKGEALICLNENLRKKCLLYFHRCHWEPCLCCFGGRVVLWYEGYKPQILP
jgi:homoaconitase/3-isopropylmalate dehydratase large subunit